MHVVSNMHVDVVLTLSKLFNKVPVPAEPEPSKIEDPAGTNRPELSSGAPLFLVISCYGLAVL